ncbi:MAG: plastocyanin/azurin family copper-binding protein [Bryobacteraceae bacterium]
MGKTAVLVAGLIALGLVGAAADSHTVVQKNRLFSQKEITLHTGDSIDFQNADEVTHNVFSMTPGMEFEIRRQLPGASSSIVFSKEGTAEVRCSIHPKMKLLVHVKD